MRLKKLLSLVLAATMTLSLITVASAADTKVYFAEDFSSYTDIDNFHSSANVINRVSNKGIYHGPGASDVLAMDAKRKELGTSVIAFGGSDNIIIGIDQHSFTTNDFGNRALLLMPQEYINTNILGNQNLYNGASVGYGIIMVMAKESWDLTNPANADETYIVSYEMDAETTKFPAEHSMNNFQRPIGTIWQKADGSGFKEKGAAKLTVSAPAKRVAVEGETPDSKYSGLIYTPASRYTLNVIMSQWSSITANTNIDSGKAVRIAYSYKYNNTEEPRRAFAIDAAGVPGWENSLNFTSDDSVVDHTIYTKIDGMYIASLPHLSTSVANLRMYTVKNGSFKTYIENNKDVDLATRTIRVKFGNPVAPSSWSDAVVVTKNGVTMTEGYAVGKLKHSVTVEGGAYSYVDIAFDSLEEGAEYTIDFADTIKNEIGVTLGATKSVATFATKLPDVKLNSLTVVGAAHLVANAGLQKTKMELENTTSANKSVAIIYTIYATDGYLANVFYINDEIVANETAEIEVDLDYAVAGEVKTFVWNKTSALKPYTGMKTLIIAEQ